MNASAGGPGSPVDQTEIPNSLDGMIRALLAEEDDSDDETTVITGLVMVTAILSIQAPPSYRRCVNSMIIAVSLSHDSRARVWNTCFLSTFYEQRYLWVKAMYVTMSVSRGRCASLMKADIQCVSFAHPRSFRVRVE